MKLALHSANPRLGDVAANVRAVAAAVAKREADIVVFPEMFLTGYAIGDAAQRLAFAQEPAGSGGPVDKRLQPILDACRMADSYLVAGGPRTPRKGITHNSAFLFGPDGAVACYDKRCLPTFTTFSEGQFFTSGTTSPVWSTEHGKLGIGICYDLYFPEQQKSQVLHGADVLLNISASPAPSRPFFESLLQARAIENACFSAYSNCVGAQDNIVFWGGAQAIGPRGQRLGALKPYETGQVIVDLDLDDLRAAREFRPTIRDSNRAEVDALAVSNRHPIAALQGKTVLSRTTARVDAGAPARRPAQRKTAAPVKGNARQTRQARRTTAPKQVAAARKAGEAGAGTPAARTSKAPERKA